MQLREEVILKGCSICRGIAIGKSFFLNRDDFAISETDISSSQIDRDIERYRHAITLSKQDIKKLQKQLELESASEGVIVLEAQHEMLLDPLFTSEIEEEIQKNQKNVEFILQQALLKYEERFKSLHSSYFAERFQDLQDLSNRIFGYLHETRGRSPLNDIPPNSVVFAQELTASDAASAHSFCVSAFVTESGGTTTHAAIVAKAKGIPFISNIPLNILKEHAGEVVIVDGRTGKLILNPTEKTKQEYEHLQARMKHQINYLEQVTKWPAQTFDGYSIRLCANLDMTHEIDLIHKLGGEGIGLFRSEYIFLPKSEIPSEDEQFKIYHRIVERMKDLPVIIRTFDLGGDKVLPHYSYSSERNPFLGSRATRFFLKQQKLFKAQIRAILRASVYGNVSILFPMITNLLELREAKRLVNESREELQLFHPVRIGCMIEVPSAALIVDHFAKECDFLSIGTNDLVQYALAIHRGDQTPSEFYEPTDPSVIRLIKLITSESNKAHIPVSVCGEIASDPRFTALLLGLGIQELSVAPRYLPIIKNAIRRTSIVEAVQLAEKALGMTTAQEVFELLIQNYYNNVPDDLFYSRV